MPQISRMTKKNKVTLAELRSLKNEALNESLCVFDEHNKKLIVTLPIRTISPNVHEWWRKTHNRHLKWKNILLKALLPFHKIMKLPCDVTFVRYGKRMLDEFENLPMSNKFLKDQIAELLTGLPNGRGDSDKRIEWHCRQEKSKTYSLKIILEF